MVSRQYRPTVVLHSLTSGHVLEPARGVEVSRCSFPCPKVKSCVSTPIIGTLRFVSVGERNPDPRTQICYFVWIKFGSSIFPINSERDTKYLQ